MVVIGVFVYGLTHCADDFAGLVNHGDRLAERRHRKWTDGDVYHSPEGHVDDKKRCECYPRGLAGER